MKVLVDSFNDQVLGTYQEPLSFSLSGRYVINIPQSISIFVSSTSPSDVITSKQSAIESVYPEFTYSEFDEFLDVSRIDTSLSDSVVVGPKKRTVILPGGRLVTTSITPPITITKLLLHYNAYTLYRDVGATSNPAAAKMLLNYDPNSGFFQFLTSMVTVTVTDNAGVDQFTTTPDIEQTIGTPSTFRLAFTNTIDMPIHLGDWAFLYV